jgi:hypothetical protein
VNEVQILLIKKVKFITEAKKNNLYLEERFNIFVKTVCSARKPV